MLPLLIHTTDLFHPHGDPDDHYDLATAFALAASGRVELAEIIIDYPPEFRAGDPALLAVEQLNYLTGLRVPASVERPSDPALRSGSRQVGERFLSILAAADRPVTISIVGSSAGVFAAYRKDPELFRKKCAAIYLNSGCGVDTPEKEFNVRLNPAAFAGVLSMDVPLYWCPCYHTIRDGIEYAGEYGTVWKHRQADVLETLSDGLLNYFLYMYSRSSECRWLRCLEREPDRDLLAQHSDGVRRLWSTAALLHLGGIEAQSYEFLPVTVRADPEGNVVWERAERSDRRIFHIRDAEAYPAELLGLLRGLLGTI